MPQSRLSRRSVLALSAGLPLAGLSQSADKPNVVLIMTDDQGWGDLSGHGNRQVKTPNIDRLAAQGTEFTRFTVSPVCAPTRSSLLTGRYTMRTGVHGVTAGRETMRTNEVTIGKALQGNGYRTGLFGKWHLGENYPHVPHAMGFDEFVGFRLGHWNRYFDAPAERNGKPIKLSGYVTDALTDEALRFIEANRERPFFAYVAYNAPHSPYQVPDKYFDRHKAAVDSPELAAIYGMVENIDDNVGRLLGKLDEWKLTGNTIVIFLCDNGPQTQRFVSGLRGRKGQVYEGGTRSPFFVRWPGHVEAGRKVDRIAAHIDVYPTLLELCGAKAPASPKLDGVSLAPLLRSGSQGVWPDRMIFTHADHQPDPLRPFPGSVREQRWKMVNGTELYDLQADPGELKNAAGEHPDQLARLNEAYATWFRSVCEGFTVGHPPIPVGYWEENPAVLSAPQAVLSGGLRYYGKNGFAHDFITGWTSSGTASWEIDVRHGGRYELWLELLSQEAGAGVQVAVGDESLEAKAARADSLEPNHLPERAPHGTAAPDMNWTLLRMGRMPIEPGRRTVKVTGMPTHLKSVQMRRIR